MDRVALHNPYRLLRRVLPGGGVLDFPEFSRVDIAQERRFMII